MGYNSVDDECTSPFFEVCSWEHIVIGEEEVDQLLVTEFHNDFPVLNIQRSLGEWAAI